MSFNSLTTRCIDELKIAESLQQQVSSCTGYLIREEVIISEDLLSRCPEAPEGHCHSQEGAAECREDFQDSDRRQRQIAPATVHRFCNVSPRSLAVPAVSVVLPLVSSVLKWKSYGPFKIE